MKTSRTNRHAFRPTLGEQVLEERVVMSTLGTTVVRNHDSLLLANALNNLTSELSGRNLNRAVTQQVRTATHNAQIAIRSHISQLYANGKPTAQQKANFLAMSNGVLAATALQLSSLASLLPAGSNLLNPRLQGSLLGSQSSSVASRIAHALQSGRAGFSSQSLTTVITQSLNHATSQGVSSFNTYLNGNTPFSQSLDQTGNVIPLGQFIGNQIITQLRNNLGSLSQSFSQLAGSMLFANGATTATAANQQAFAGQFSSALGVAASQLSVGLSLSPSLASSLAPQLQSALFNTSSTSNSLFNSIQNLPTSNDLFNTGASTAFNSTFQGLNSLLSTPFNLPASTTASLPGGNTPGLFGSQFSNFGNGFTTGFGTGYPGFGVPTSNFNTNFGTGFNNIISTVNTNFGFSVPTFDGTGSLTGTGNGTGTFLGAGSTPTGTFDGTGTLTGTGSGTGTGGSPGTNFGSGF